MCLFEEDIVPLFLVFGVPIVALAGWLLAGIVRTISAHRLLEAAVQERIALIARGVDPERIPAAATLGGLRMSHAEYERHRAQGLFVWGFALLAGGVTFALVASTLDAWTEGDWPIGVVAAAIGAALLLSSALVWPRGKR